MVEDYKHNHYVPEWYQKRFLPAKQAKNFYLDLRPAIVTNAGHTYTRRDLLKWGPRNCFAEDDIYTTRYYGTKNRDIEKFFFGQVDTDGKKAVEHLSNWEFNSESAKAIHSLLTYMSVQKLRTPKGFEWLRNMSNVSDRNINLYLLQRLQNIFCTIWSECVWQIADASKSVTKFIISDHPVTVYNRECFPHSKYCVGHNDPDIRMHATHTYFPLSPDKILILTNLSWVRDPYQNPLKLRPNPNYMRPATMFSFLDIQVDRFLTEEEVIQINWITKLRAYRYIAAAKEEWLYPERRLRSPHWRKLGNGYLLMPDPRHIHGGGEIFVKYENGRHDSWSEYGHKPWQKGYDDKQRTDREWKTMQRFKAEWTAEFGPEYRGITHSFSSSKRPVRTRMDDEYYAIKCRRDREYLRQPGEKARRRKLKDHQNRD